MRIGLFHATLPVPGRKPGGVDVAVHQLANALARDGRDEVTVLSLAARPPDAAYAHRQLLAGSRWPVGGKLSRMTAWPALLNTLHLGDGLDVLHLHGDDWFYVRRTCPTVRTLHGSALLEARTATSLKRRLSQRAIYRLEHRAARLATVSLAVGPQTVALYRADRLADNGVDVARFHPGPKADVPTVLFVGTWAGRKRGQFLFDRFVNVIRPAVPAAELVMVCDHCPPAPGVRHIVAPGDDALAGLYRSAWAFAYPSVYEGFGLPYLEAMASGTAVVSSPNPGAAHVLRDGRLGLVVADADFAPAVVRLLTDPAERERLATAGRAAAEGFGWDRIADAHRDAYRLAVERWGHRR